MLSQDLICLCGRRYTAFAMYALDFSRCTVCKHPEWFDGDEGQRHADFAYPKIKPNDKSGGDAMTKEMQVGNTIARDWVQWAHQRISALVKSGRDDLRELRNSLGKTAWDGDSKMVSIAPWILRSAKYHIYEADQ